jgi:hypothetical protein
MKHHRRPLPVRQRRQRQGRRLVAASNDVAACELQCLNGGLCRWVSTDAIEIQGRMTRGESVQECLCQPGYGGTGCEVHVGMCPDLHNADECACALASQISALASEKYCTTSDQGVAFCYATDDQATQQNASVSLQDVGFCVNGGMCTGSVLGNTDSPSNVFAYKQDECLCPVDFDGPHCEFLKKYGGDFNSSRTEGISDGASNGSTTTTIDDALQGSLIQDDDVPLQSDGAPSSPSITSESLPDRTTAWSVLACICGVALVAIVFVLYRKCSRRRKREASATSSPIAIPSRRPESLLVAWIDPIRKRTYQKKSRMMGEKCSHIISVENSITKASPSSTEGGTSTLRNKRYQTWWRSFRLKRHPPKSAYSESITSTSELEIEAVACRNDLAEKAKSMNCSSRQGRSSPPGCDEDDEVLFDDDEILIGTFDSYAYYRQEVVASRVVGETRFEGETCSDQLILFRAPAASAFATFQPVTSAASSQIEEIDIADLDDQSSLHSDSSSSYCSSESGLPLANNPIEGSLYPRDSGLLSPNSLYTSSSEQFSASLTRQALANASFSDYSSFPDSITDGASLLSPDEEGTSSDDGSSSGITMDLSEQRYFATESRCHERACATATAVCNVDLKP